MPSRLAPRRRRSSASSTRTSAATTAGARRRSWRTRSASRTSTPPTCRSRPGFFGTLVDHTGVFGEAERFAADGAGRRPDDVLGPRVERLELGRAADARAGAPGRARARRALDPPLGHQRAEGLRAGLPLPPDAVRAALRGAAAAERRGGPRGAAPGARGGRGLLHVADVRGPGGRHARDRRRRARASPHAMVVVDEAWGGHLHFHPGLPESAMAAGADVCVQSTHKLAGGLQQTGPDALARGPRRLRADGGGLPRVRDDLALLPPAGVGRRGGADARRAGRGGARAGHRADRRAEGGAPRGAPGPRLDGRRRLAALRARPRARRGTS